MKKYIALLLVAVSTAFSLCSCSCSDSKSDLKITFSHSTQSTSTAINSTTATSDAQENTNSSDKSKNNNNQQNVIRFSTAVTKQDTTGSSYLAFDVLTPTQYKIYDEILRGMNSFQPLMDFKDVSEFDLIYAYNAVNKYNPSIFWFPKKYEIIHYSGGFNLKPHYEYTEEQVAGMKRKIDASVNSLLADIPKSSTDYNFTLAVYEKLCNTISYDKNLSSESSTIYGTLVSEKATCEGYARTYQYLLQLRGVQSVLVCGNVDNTGHMWNKVLINGEWYNVDVTLGDSDDILNHAYYNRTDAEFQSDHTADRIIKSTDKVALPYELDFNVPLPSCNSTLRGYFQKIGMFIEKNSDFEKVIADAIKKGGDEVSTYEFGTSASVSALPKKDSAEFSAFAKKVLNAVRKVSDKSVSLYGVSGGRGFTIELN